MIPGFHVGGLLLHDQAEAIAQVARLGYRCVAIKPRPGSLDPCDPRFSEQILRIADAVQRAGVSVVIDTDALFMHDPTSPRGPSLVTRGRGANEARQWIEQWIEVAAEIGSDLVTFSSGQPDGEIAQEELLERVSGQLNDLAAAAAKRGIRLAIRPVSGDAIASVAQFERLGQWLGEQNPVGLAADVGEMLLGHELPVGDRLARNIGALTCVYLCDHRAGSAGDQRIGHGDVVVSRITASLAEQGFQGPAIVRVSGHSELGFVPAEESIHIFDGLA